jgi:hypothetical protein
MGKMPLFSILKGFHHPAQGCDEGATLGVLMKERTTPTGLWRAEVDRTQSRWDCGVF